MKKDNKNRARTLTLYAVFGVVLAFAVMVLVFFIYQDFLPKIPGAIVIGILIALAIKLFGDAVKRDEEK